MPGAYSSIKSLVHFLKLLPKSIETIDLHPLPLIKASGNPTHIQNIYRNLCKLRKLRTLKIDLSLSFNRQDQEWRLLNKMEYKSINRYIPRLNNLKEFDCEVSYDNGVVKFQRFMSQAQECPSVTGLTLDLNDNYFEDQGQVQNNTIPQFRLYLFPSLIRLWICVHVHGDRIMSLDSSISEGLKSLVQLKEFAFWSSKRIENLKFLFEGLSHLPLLDIFELSVLEIENSEEISLVEFLQRQTLLVKLVLSIYDKSVRSRMRFEEQNYSLEMMCQSLKDMSRLKHLCLYSYIGIGSLESLSKGLSHARLTNQLKTFEILSFEDISISSSPNNNNNKIKGLCDFIERQKLSLRSLRMRIGCVKEDEIVDSLIRAIGETEKLEVFHLIVNEKSTFNSLENNKLFQDISRESLKGYPSFNHSFACLNQILPRLKDLNDLNLCLNPLTFPFDVTMIDSSVVLKALASLKNLRSLSLCLPFLKESFMLHPTEMLQQLSKMKTLVECNIITASDSEERIEEIEEALKQTKRQRYFKQRLKF